MPIKVSKFGGTSLADAEKVMAVKKIVLGDGARRIIVPSAPGKRGESDVKITDLLIKSKEELLLYGENAPSFSAVSTRFSEMANALGVRLERELFSEIAEKYIAEKRNLTCRFYLSVWHLLLLGGF